MARAAHRQNTTTAIRAVAPLLALCALGCEDTKAAPPPPPAASGKLAGSYEIKSATHPSGGKSHEGQVEIAKSGAVYLVRWDLKDRQGFRGVALEADDFLFAGWGPSDSVGVGLYEITLNGLHGRWSSVSSAGKLGAEVLAGPSGLNGTYRIVESYAPDGSGAYGGTMTISPNGLVYRVQRKLDSGRSYAGIGIKKKKWFMVAWAEAGNAGATVYTLKERGLSGQWAQPTSTDLGTEFLVKARVK